MIQPLAGGLAPLGVSRALAAAFTPSQITGLALWLKADAITGLSDGDAITAWTDSSDNGNNATQGTAGVQPTYSTGIVNGKPVARFDGGDRLINTAASITADHTAFVVGCVTGGSGYQRMLHFGASGPATSGGDFRLFFGAINGNFATFWGTATGAAWNDTAANTPTQSVTNFSILTAKRDGAVGTPYKNGTAQNAKNSIGTRTSTGYAVGASAAESIQWLIGDIAEVIIYDSALSDANRQAVEAYLSAKYGIALT